MTLQQIDDLREEARELGGLLATLDDGDWERETTFKRWTINDVIRHLHWSDYMGLQSATDPDNYVKLRDAFKQRRDGGATLIEITREKLGHLGGGKLRDIWKSHLEELCTALATKGPDARLIWSGPDMGVRMFATARQMEVWAHGQEIYDVLGKTRSNGDRIKNIAVIGVKTYGWTFANRKLEVPGPAPYVRLTAPSGAVWEWNDHSEDNVVAGSAVEFCQVVAQVRNIADTQLTVEGEPARRWMEIAQCFAGPPETPPAPGSRVPGGSN